VTSRCLQIRKAGSARLNDLVRRRRVERRVTKDGSVVDPARQRRRFLGEVGGLLRNHLIRSVADHAHETIGRPIEDVRVELDRDNNCVAGKQALDDRAADDLIALNLAPAVVGCATAIRRFLAGGTGGTVVMSRRTRPNAP
jgi:hypothetical protein